MRIWLAAVVVSVVSVGRGVPCVAPLANARAAVAVDRDNDGIDDGFEQALANRWAPVVYIEPDESNYPTNVDWFLARAGLQYHEDCFFDHDDTVVHGTIGSQANLIGPPWRFGPYCGEDDTGYSHPPHRPLLSTAADPDGQVSAGAATTGYSDQQTYVIPDVADRDRLGSTYPADWKTYVHVYPSADGGVMIQYWHFFSYNALAFAGIGNHGGDWDAEIQVQLDRHLQLERVFFSRHSNDHPGDSYAPGNPNVTLYNGTHTIMAIDGGGHAAYASVPDFCAHQATIIGSTATWTTDPTDPLNPDKLQTPPCAHDAGLRGGIVWETRDGGTVRSSPGLTHPLAVSPSGHGGIDNLGEYNPCTPATCNGSAQASTLENGEFHPLNGNLFLEFEGRWGSLPHQSTGAGVPPRGPVFQGWVDNGSGHTSVYTAWYNQGAASKALDRDIYPWLQPPVTRPTVGGPAYKPPGDATLVAAASTVTLAATQSNLAAGFGAPTTYHRDYPIGGLAGPYIRDSRTFTIRGADGPHTIDYYSMDAIGNIEPIQTLRVILDTTPPQISALGLAPTSFRASRTGPSIMSSSKRGTKISYRLSENATVTFTVEQALAGRKSRGRCLTPTPARRRLRRCTRHVLLRGAFSHDGRAGQNTFRFTGRLANATLKHGAYRLIATAYDPVGNGAVPVRSNFTIHQ